MDESRILKGQCENCGCKLQFQSDMAEKVIVCPKCKSQVTVVAPQQPLAAKLHDFPCPNCGSHMQVKRSLIGKVTKCQQCEQKIRVPEPSRGPRSNDEESEEEADGAFTLGDWLVCIFLPVPIGVLVGFMRLVQGKRNGGAMIGYSLLFVIVWLSIRLLFFALSSLTAR